MSTAHEAHSEEHGHGHHGSPFIQHHYDDAQHQFDAGKLGIWIFLAQEVLFFSALFVAYILYRVHHPEVYSYAHKWLDVKYGAINTAVLIFSSLTAAWAVRCAQLNQRKGLIACIAVTIVCACTFLGIKYIEYSHKVHEHILFGRYFDPCISPGGAELLTKHNDCPGTKTTIDWSRGQDGALQLETGGKATAGCFEAGKIDQDPRQEGVQADCSVVQVTREQMKTKGPDGRIKLDWVDKGTKEIGERCEEENLLEAAEHPGQKKAQKYPCWRTAYQPAVCPDLTSPDDRARGAASKPQVGILVEYGDSVERGDNMLIKAECKAPPKAEETPADANEGGETQLKVGKKAIQPVHILTEHEEHELESMGPPPEHTNMFLSVYFAMTGLHGIHVVVGVMVFIWLLIRAVKGQFSSDYFGPVDYAALYWHIVDLIWIFLFPLLYLIH